MSKPKILYVDDEAVNLSAFASLLRRKYTVLTAERVSEAFALLNAHPDVQVIVADERMPEQRGILFLEEVKQRMPESIRILLTAFADTEVLHYAINKSGISYFVEKPWNENILEVTLDNAVELYQSKTDIKEKNIALQKTNDALTRLVYSASHEMRAPLTNILGLVKIAQVEEDIQEMRSYFDIIETSVLQLDDFLRKLIGYYKNTRVENELNDIDFSALTDEIIEQTKFIDGASNIRFEVSVSQSGTFVSDATRIKMILMNLISNAIKFQKSDGNPGRIFITITSDEAQARIVLKDEGVGIEPEEQERIFSMFYKSMHPRSGTGIGLFIVKESIDKLKGKIFLNASGPEGTTFEIQIPALN